MCALGAGVLVGKGLAIALVILGTLAMVVAVEPVARRLPSFRFERGDGFALRVRAPELAGKRRLKAQTFQLVRDIRVHVKDAYPRSRAQDHAKWAEMVAASQRTTDEEARTKAWTEYIASSMQRRDREGVELAELFGGRIIYLAGEYQRRGMLSERDVRHLQWEAGSLGWITDAANQLEALARKL